MKSSNSKGKNNARTRRGLKTTSGGGAGAVRCVGSLCKDGKKGQGAAKVSETSQAGKGAEKGKKKCGWVRGRLR